MSYQSYSETTYSSFFAAIMSQRTLQRHGRNVAIVETTIDKPNGRNVRSCRVIVSDNPDLLRAGTSAWIARQVARGWRAHVIR